MLYTIGVSKLYYPCIIQMERSGSQMQKAGRDPETNYPGGSVWKTYDAAWAYLVKHNLKELDVFGVDSDEYYEDPRSASGLSLLHDAGVIVLDHNTHQPLQPEPNFPEYELYRRADADRASLVLALETIRRWCDEGSEDPMTLLRNIEGAANRAVGQMTAIMPKNGSAREIVLMWMDGLPMIVSTPGVLGGDPRIAGKRLAVHRLVAGTIDEALQTNEQYDALLAEFEVDAVEALAALAYASAHVQQMRSLLDVEIEMGDKGIAESAELRGKLLARQNREDDVEG